MKALLVSMVCLLAAWTEAAVASPTTNPFESGLAPTPHGKIDELVFGRLKQLGIQPANLSSDSVFLRRVYLDVIGTLPTAKEVREFLQDQSPNKRSVLIDQLLEREEFVDYWAMKWSDLLRVKAEFPINLWPNAAQSYHHYIRSSLKKNLPYDQFARELLTASGSNFRVGQVNFYRAMQTKTPPGIAQTVALTFMGTRAENWPKDRLAGMAAFFSQLGYKATSEWKEEIVFFDVSKTGAPPPKDVAAAPVFPDGTPAKLTTNQDPREAFANWLITPQNPWFTRNIANRLWAWLMGRGIIQEPDDIRPDNPPKNPELLAYLEKELIAGNYDLKKIYRLILNSTTYQLSSVAKSDNPEAEANFAQYSLRRLEAEVLIDALNQLTDTTEKYTSPIPEPYTHIPENVRSIALADGSISSTFLETFGRSARDTGLESERNNKPTASQRLHLLNSSHVQRKLEQSKKFQYLIQNRSNPREVVAGLYLMILSRMPTEEETKIALGYTQSGSVKGREAVLDLAWALINSAEFIYRH